MTATAAANGSTRIGSTNFSTATITNGVKNGTYLVLNQSGANAQGQTVTITFPQPVYCVRLSVNDIDTQFRSAADKYRDSVEVTGFTPSTVPASSGILTISGSSAYPTAAATSTSSGGNYDNLTSAAGLAQFSAPGPLSAITLRYINNSPGTGTTVDVNQQQVYISALTYKTRSGCTCP
ncbi:hypothetical protein [Kocuria sp.]|uniref:hypothetical protein n=1 Tax=Kocuria sp. TaxID=1871328 RepID=UPI0026DCFBF4|nr:hypothetical protein [Kocuria sp.]MDO4919602.1 hypothetical protein [Kocuria sp.]